MSDGLGIQIDSREGVSQEIARKLIDYILSGEVAPGHRMPSERQLSVALGVGRSAVREALKSLGLLGLVEVRQGDGTYLRKPDSDLLPRVIEWGLLLGERRTLDLVDARRHLEVTVARLAAERRDENDLRVLRDALEQMAAQGDAAHFVDADVAFHMAIAGAAKNGVLFDVLNSIRSLLKVWIRRAITQAGETGTSYQEHVPIYQAIVDGRTEDAAAAMRAHMDEASERLRQSIEAG